MSVCLLVVGCGDAAPSAQEAEHVGEARSALVAPFKLRVSAPSSQDFRAFAVGANEQLRFYDRSKVLTESGAFAPVMNAGSANTNYYLSAQTGSVTSAASIFLHDNSKVNGAAITAGAITKWTGATVTGPSTQSASLSPTTLSWTVPFETSTNDQTAGAGQTISLAPGAYRSLTSLAQGRFKLRTGTYYVDQLNLATASTLELDTSSGPVRLYARTSLVFRSGIVGGAPERFLLGYAGELPVVFDSSFRGTVVAPSAPVRFATPSAQHVGSVFAKSVDIDPDVTLTHKPYAGWDEVRFDVTPRFECVQTAPNGTKVATFGYLNPNAKAVSVAVGSDNRFSSGATNRLQPSTFLPGAYSSDFSIGYTGTAPEWQLNGTSASVVSSKVCTNSFAVSAVADATLNQSSPSANFGTSTTLEASSGKSSLLRFDRQAVLRARGAGRLIKTARLEVEVSSGSATLDAHAMRQDWVETSATWSCGKDQDPAAATARCHMMDRWELAPRPHTDENPYQAESVAHGTPSSGKVVFDVTEDVQRFVASEAGTFGRMSWLLRSPSGQAVVMHAREANKAAKLVIEAVPFSDMDLAGNAPFSFSVDGSLATGQSLPSLDGQPRPLAVLKPSDGTAIQFAENELIVATDDPIELNAIKARWAATEIATTDTVIPGLAKGHVLRIDTSRATPATLVPHLRQAVNRPDGVQRVSSATALGVLAAAAEESARGTLVGVNWLAPGAKADLDGIKTESFDDGAPQNGSIASQEPSSNAYEWDHFVMHEVPKAWELLYYTKKLKKSIDVGFVDAGFSLAYQDQADRETWLCTGGECENPFNCGGGSPCPWHGVHTAGAGFGEVNNRYGGAGPGAGVGNLDLWWGFGDMATTIATVPILTVIADDDIINFSNAIPVPDYLFYTTIYAEAVMWAARHVTGTLIFASAGNEGTNVDERRCFNLLLGDVCPWEKAVWFPCEGAGVKCVGATNYSDKGRASYSNYGGDVDYWASGTALAGADPANTDVGSAFRFQQGTSFSSPFMAGVAALTWAANRYKINAGDVETCLDAAKFGGPDGRFVNAFFATACGLGNPSNVPPLVEIVQPDQEDLGAGLGLVQLRATAGDFEDGAIDNIGWYDETGALLGTTLGSQPFLYFINSSGLYKITAKVLDAQGAEGTDTVTFSATPAPPNLKIHAPDGEDVPLGLPVDLVGEMTNFSSLTGLPPYETSIWVGYHENSILFDHVTGASTQATFNQVGESRVTWTMTVDGLRGMAERKFKVVSDGKLHVKITSPSKDNVRLDDGSLKVSFTNETASTLSAVSTSDVQGGVTYVWTLTKVDGDGVTRPFASLNGQTVSFTPSGFRCGTSAVRLNVLAINQTGERAHDVVNATVGRFCDPE